MSEDLNKLEADLVRAILTRYHTTRLSTVSAESHVLNGFVVRQALDRLVAARLQAAEERAFDWSEYEDEIAEAISESMDMDWTSRDGAKAVVRELSRIVAALKTEGA